MLRTLVVQYICVPTPPPLILLYADGTKRFNPRLGLLLDVVQGLTTLPMLLPPYPSSVDWYDGTVLGFSTRSHSSLSKFVPFGHGYNDGRTPTMAITFSAVIFGALISMCLVSTLFVVDLLSPIDRRRCHQ